MFSKTSLSAIRGGNCHLRDDNTLPLYIHDYWQWQTVLTMDTYLIIIIRQ
jgi:hypothetical protein